ACVYDWCYDLLTDGQKRELIDALKWTAGSHAPGYPAEFDTHVVVGHGTEGWVLTGQLPAGIAIYDEDPQMYDAAARLVVGNFAPARDFLYAAHMHHQGDSYYATRFQHDIAASWLMRAIGGGDLFSREQQYVAYQPLYHLRPDGQQMRSGDTFDERGRDSRKRLIALLTATYYDDPYLMTAADSDVWGSARAIGAIFSILYRKPDSPTRAIDELPLTKYFAEPMGEMVARTGWDMGVDSASAVVQMRIGGTFFGNHQCKDFGTFQIYYRGALALATGIYEGGSAPYGSPHWKNWLHQTVSKNGLLIFDPSEDMGRGSANDGGQRWPAHGDHPKNLSVLTSDEYAYGHVTGHAFGPDARQPVYSYIAGDITNAYASAKASTVVRSMVTLNTGDATYPATLIVHDRLISTRPDFRKTWLLHSIEQPTVNGTTITVRRVGEAYGGGAYGGKLVAESLLPREADIDVIGGPGREFWIESAGTNFAATKAAPAEPGAWRVEVSTDGAREHEFLHVLTVMDDTTPAGPRVTTVEAERAVAVDVLGHVVVFADGEPEFVTADGETRHVLVCGLASGAWDVSRDGVAVDVLRVTSDAASAYFEADPGAYALTRR
ncbi:hypothetical protein HN937_13240, partial [Candidatus Poribacteria bacterium]|nr:hypothetical protein [Candidatus Poribacteria bacterium]